MVSKTTKAAALKRPPAPPKPPAAPTKGEADKGRAPDKRWTPVLVKDGYTPISTFFLKYVNELQPEITHGEAMFIIQLMIHKWDEDMPYPAFKTIAKRMGIGHGQARKLARALQTKGYLYRNLRKNNTNLFDLRPLFRSLETLRAKKLKDREAEAAKRKGPRPL